MVKQSEAFQAGHLEMLGAIKSLTGPGLLCGQQNSTLSLRLTCQRLISITCEVTVGALYSSLWSVNSTKQCWNQFLIHCKWLPVQLAEWLDHTAIAYVVLSAQSRAPAPLIGTSCLSATFLCSHGLCSYPCIAFWFNIWSSSILSFTGMSSLPLPTNLA